MNLFVGTPGDDSHPMKCAGCHRNVFLNDAMQHQGLHYCMDCHSKGKHKMHGPGFGPVRFEGHNRIGEY